VVNRRNYKFRLERISNIVFVFIFFLATTSNASTLSTSKTLDFPNRKIVLPFPSNWELNKDLFGLPFVAFAPERHGQRSNISIQYSEVKVAEEFLALAQDQKSYLIIKENWAKKVEAKIGSVIPYRQFKNDRGHQVHLIGIKYDFAGKKYLEKSAYVLCHGELAFLKLLSLEASQEDDLTFEQMLKGVDCRR